MADEERDPNDISPDLGVNSDQGFQDALAAKGLGPDDSGAGRPRGGSPCSMRGRFPARYRPRLRRKTPGRPRQR